MADSAGLDALETDVAAALFEVAPTWAVQLGRHDYDGRLPDYAPAATASWATRARGLLDRLAAIDDATLPADRRVDRFLLRLALEGNLFDLDEARKLETNPMTYLSVLSLSPYITREYAPAGPRMEAVGRLLRGVPRLLATGRARLQGPLPKPFVELALSIGRGLPSHFEEAEKYAAGQGLGASVTEARAVAEVALASFLVWLHQEELPRAVPEFALGAERYQRLLFVREGIEAPYADIRKAGTADLARNHARLAEIAARERAPISAVIARLEHELPVPEKILDEAAAFVEEARAFVAGHDLATIPEPTRCRVEETPAWGRATTTASMDQPGPFDAGSAEGIYYVTTVDPAWSDAQRREWLRSLSRPMLRNITVHEVYPGHYLQALHLRLHPLSLARKVCYSPSFVEGWAHYTEQLAIEAGLGNGSDSAEVAQLVDALLRDCRLLASVGLHTEGKSVEWATKLFETEAFLDPLPAQREALRGTFDPEYFCYTLGKLAILDVRHRHLAGRFGGSLRAFHDAVLSFGCPPVGLLDGLLGALPAVSSGSTP
ncbi:MAG TPA: DUF885 domain-containing protein [Thermoplasmata archaeon]|nr:DUF885 domain-containing protein [Thermoplasmata archaeon]